MIAFFPELYEDELAYSWFSRYYTKSGYLSLRYALDDLYVKRYVNPDTEFVNELRPEVKELVIKHCGMEKLILGHTMFSSYGRFLPDAKKQEAYRALLDMNGNFNNLLAIPKNRRGTGRTLRYCPLCVKEDRKAYGETYWHRIHQIQGIQICGMAVILQRVMFLWREKRRRDYGMQNLSYRRNWKCGCVKRRRKPPLQGMHAGFLRGGCRLRAGYPWQSF